MIVAGFGFRASASLYSLRNAYEQAAESRAVVGLATLADKAKCPAFQSLAEGLGLPVHHVDANAIADVITRTNSAHAWAARQTGSVAEAAALAAAGPGARLIQVRVVSTDRLATCALAQTREGGEAI